MKKYYEILKKYHGSHRAVAKELQISESQYRRVRNGKSNGSNALKRLIKIEAERVIPFVMFHKKKFDTGQLF